MLYPPPPPPFEVIESNTESTPGSPAALEFAPPPPPPIVTVYEPGEVDTGNAAPANGCPARFVLKPPAPPPPPFPRPPPPPPATQRYSTSAGKVPSALTSKVPDDVKNVLYKRMNPQYIH